MNKGSNWYQDSSNKPRLTSKKIWTDRKVSARVKPNPRMDVKPNKLFPKKSTFSGKSFPVTSLYREQTCKALKIFSTATLRSSTDVAAGATTTGGAGVGSD